MTSASPSRFPRLTSYLAGLPRGLDSYPECQARTSLCKNFLDSLPTPRPRPDQVPEPFARALVRLPAALWMPEVHAMAISLAIADHYGFDDAAYLRWVHEANSGYFRSVLLRVLMAFVSPAELVARASARWSSIHTGSTLTATLVDKGRARVVLEFPSGLFAARILLEHFNAVWQAVFEHSKAKNCQVRLVDATETRAIYEATWS